MRKKLSIAIAIIAIIAIALPVSSQGPPDLNVGAPLAVESTFAGAEKGGPEADKPVALQSAASRQSAAAAGFELVSIIVTFEDGVEPADLEAVGKGQVIYRYKKVFNGASMILPGGNIEAVAAMEGGSTRYRGGIPRSPSYSIIPA